MIFQPRNNRDILLSTILFSVSFAPSPFGYLIYFALIPVIRMSIRSNPRDAFFCGYIVGLLTSMILLHWIAIYNPWYYLIFIPINALQIGVFTLIISVIGRRNRIGAIIIFPFLWTSLDFLREFGPFAFTWLNIGYTQSNFLYLIQFAEFTGTIGIIFWICLVNMLLLLLWDYRHIRFRLALFMSMIILLFLLPFVHGKHILTKERQMPGIVCAYIQPNIRNEIKWAPSLQEKNLWKLLAESQNVLSYSPGLIIWPETALPYDYKKYPQLNDILSGWVVDHRLRILTGILDREGSERYNAAVLIDGKNPENVTIYHKMRPVPIAEKSMWLWTSDTNAISSGIDYTLFDFSVSEIVLSYKDEDWKIDARSLNLKDVHFAVLICFESAFPTMAQKMTEKGADFLTIMTNDESFGYSAQPHQHLQIARMRAIENRRSVIHCANTGISAFIDPLGNIFQRSGLFEPARAVQPVPLWTSKSFYTLNAHWMGWIYISISLILGVYLIFRSPIKEGL